MTDPQLATRIRRGLVEYADATPVPDPPSFVAPESPQRRRLSPALAAAAVTATVLAVTVIAVTGPIGGGGRGTVPGATEDPPTLPDRFAEYSITTGTVADSPPGRVIACFLYNTEEFWDPPQVVVLAADADRYRVVTAADTGRRPLWERRPVLLSGNGERLAVGSGDRATSAIPVVDLLTGVTTEHAVEAGSRVDLLAWSPDARWLVYAIRPFQESTAFPGLHARGGQLWALDVHSGQTQRLGATEIPDSVAQAAFSPDGSLLAVQAGGPDGAEHRQRFGESVVIVRFTDARIVATAPVPPYYRLAGPAAWSPDASRLALVAEGYSRPEQAEPWLRTLERTEAGVWSAGPEAAPGVPDGLFLGWQSRDRVVLHGQAGDPAQPLGAILAVDVDGSALTELSRIEVEARSDMNLTSMQLAYVLLPDLQVRPAAEPNRGPWPTWLRAVAAITALLAVGAAWASVAVVRARRRTRA